MEPSLWVGVWAVSVASGAENKGVFLVGHEGGLMDDESKVHTMFKTTRNKAPRVDVTHGKPLRTAKATDPKGF